MTQNKFAKILRAYDATIDFDMLDAQILQVDAPPGKVWARTGTHTLTEGYRRGEPGYTISDARQSLAEDMTWGGLDDCEDLDCDVCAAERKSRTGNKLDH